MTDRKNNRDVTKHLLDSFRLYMDSPSLTVNGENWSYNDLLAVSKKIAGSLIKKGSSEKPVVAIWAHKTWAAYASILSSILFGCTYVPLHPRFPVSRNLSILRKSGASLIIFSENQKELVKHLLEGDVSLQESMELVTCPESKSDAMVWCKDNTLNSFISFQEPKQWHVSSDIAYVLFTSGSTGTPKGVPISYKNLSAYLNNALDVMEVNHYDRFSQTFDLTFDLSVHDIFVCWSVGGHLIVPTPKDIKNPVTYINENSITCWFSVPSLANQMRVQKRLQYNAFPSLRISQFCGEVLTSKLARAWQDAAPNSLVENWYGPTEATIACTKFTVSRESEILKNNEPNVPIGKPFSDVQAVVCSENLTEVANGIAGELLLAGPQVASEYLGDPGQTKASFVNLKEKEGRFYRTGDRVIRRVDDGELCIIGRINQQVKVRGYRIELGEVEAQLGNLTDCNVVAMTWPLNTLSATSIITVIEGWSGNVHETLSSLGGLLPEYMIPSNIVSLDTFPTNSSGKVDRNKISEYIKIWSKNKSEISSSSTDVEWKLLETITKIVPLLNISRLRESESLLAAGMDSISFVLLTTELENKFSLTLSQDDVVMLSKLSFDGIVKFVTTGKREKKLQEIKQLSTQRQIRANRAIQFIEMFPRLLESNKHPLYLFVGSSGIFRSISPPVFNEVASKAGLDIRAVNIGLPAINCQGISDICEYIKKCCESFSVRPAHIVYELDPMLISTLPPKGDITIDSRYFNGQLQSLTGLMLDNEFEWSFESAGRVTTDKDNTQLRVKPQWVSERDKEIIRTFSGYVDFNEVAINEWFRGLNLLQNLTEKTSVFIHPLNPAQAKLIDEENSDTRYTDVLCRIREGAGGRVIKGNQFNLDESDFMDINHVNSWNGMARLTEQLARLILPEWT